MACQDDSASERASPPDSGVLDAADPASSADGTLPAASDAARDENATADSGADAREGSLPSSPAVTLPLEVLGAPGTAVHVTIAIDAATLQAAQAAGSADLVLTVHNVVEPDSAEVSVNGSPPFDLGVATGPLLRRIDGRVASGAFALDPGVLRAGDNQLVFRYTRQVIADLAAVSGFRVLDVAIAIGDQSERPALPSEDPSTWTTEGASNEAIERGRAFFQDESRDGGPACARCHADSGADLSYYAFSTHSIVERAMFHEFPRADAEDIARYIRSLPLVPVGRPYDPPFQPGSGNRGAAGAGYAAALAGDDAFMSSAFAGNALPPSLPWNWAETVDTFVHPAALTMPTWMRWLPRDLPDEWFTMQAGLLASAEQALAATPSLENAQAFMSAALTIGKDILTESGDYQGKVEVLRFAAVKLWDWSRRNGFDRPDHGVPDGSPAYPYEVGFAFFEASLAGAGIPGAEAQTIEWWWAQLATNPGRGLSTGRRPLNFFDVLSAAENAAIGSAQIAFLHLYGSWEESRGSLVDQWGTGEGPVRLLLVPMRRLSASDREAILRRFLIREGEYLASGGSLDAGHHAKLTEAWTRGCAELSPAQRTDLRTLAPAAVLADLAACP